MLLFQAAATQAATLLAFAELPADTFLPGPTSGQYIETVNGREPPFLDQQPVQGFSALLKAENGRYFVLSDNGFGRRDNSADFILSIYLIHPELRTAASGSGVIHVEKAIRLSDPARYMPYTIMRETDRLLTGADLDPESFQRAPDGSYWIGEEFNPSLLHFSASGELLAPPFMLTGLASVDNPLDKPATLPRTRGFEGMAQSPDGLRYYPMLEGALLDSKPGLNIYTFDRQSRRFKNLSATDPSYRYRLDEGASAIGDFTLFSATSGLVLERDSNQGGNARIKKIYRVDFEQVDSDGFLLKSLVADLLAIQDPHDLNRDGHEFFTFPFWTIEGLIVIDKTTLAIINDNNYPLGTAREARGEQPDNTEFIVIKVAALWE